MDTKDQIDSEVVKLKEEVKKLRQEVQETKRTVIRRTYREDTFWDDPNRQMIGEDAW